VFAPLWKRSVQQADAALAESVEVVRWDERLLERYDAVVAYGSDETISAIQARLAPSHRFVGYGHKFSAAIVWREAMRGNNRVTLLAQLRRDAEPFNLQGCLSPQVVYLEREDPQAAE